MFERIVNTTRSQWPRIGLAILVVFIVVCNITSCSSTAVAIVNTLAKTDGYRLYDGIAYGPAALNTLDVYVPVKESNDSSQPNDTIVFFYGGCWGGCQTLEKHAYRFVAETLSKRGYNVVIPNYRRYPSVRFPDIIADAAASVEWVRAHIADYQGKPDRIILMGHSAGAHLAAMLTLNKAYLATNTHAVIKGFIGMAGPYDFLPFTKDYEHAVFAPPKAYPESQPINFVDGTEPPLLLLYGKDDDTVKPRNIASLKQRVLEKNGTITTREYDGIGHVGLIAALSIPLRNRRPVLKDILWFLRSL